MHFFPFIHPPRTRFIFALHTHMHMHMHTIAAGLGNIFYYLVTILAYTYSLYHAPTLIFLRAHAFAHAHVHNHKIRALYEYLMRVWKSVQLPGILSNTPHTNMWRFDSIQSQWVAARKAFEEAVELNENHPSALWHLGVLEAEYEQ